MANTQVYFDDKTLMTFITPDKILHRFFPGIEMNAVPSFNMYHKESGAANVLIGTTEIIPAKSHVMYYEPCYTGEGEITIMNNRTRHIYFLSEKVLKHVRFTKFINMIVDEDTWDVILHYWVNVLSGYKGLKGEEPAENSGEPFNEISGVTDISMMRAIAFSRGHYYGSWDDKGGAITFIPTYIFEPPQVVEVVAVWNPANDAEQVLDIHNELNEH